MTVEERRLKALEDMADSMLMIQDGISQLRIQVSQIAANSLRK